MVSPFAILLYGFTEIFYLSTSFPCSLDHYLHKKIQNTKGNFDGKCALFGYPSRKLQQHTEEDRTKLWRKLYGGSSNVGED